MRALVLLVMLGCAHDPPPAAPKGPSACARAADSMVATMLDKLSHKDAVPTDQADALRNLIRARCEQDAWSPGATSCLIAMKTQADAGPCAQQMTEAQQAALVRDEQALFSNPGGPGK